MLIPPVSNLQQAEFVSAEYLRSDEAGVSANVRGIEQKGFQPRDGLGFVSGIGHEYSGEASQPLVSGSLCLKIAAVHVALRDVARVRAWRLLQVSMAREI
jgi:hypothetical protein